MNRLFQLLMLAMAVTLVTGCTSKKQSDDIIARKPEPAKPQGPIRMQEYVQTKDIQWLDKNYQVQIKRVADDSLLMVKDENGQKYVDNRVSLRVVRADGSVFFSRTFTKASFDAQLDNDFRKTGILEGFVFDRIDGSTLVFAASVSHPQDEDEYIPMVVTVSSVGDLSIRRDTDLDTNGGVAGDEEDGV